MRQNHYCSLLARQLPDILPLFLLPLLYCPSIPRLYQQRVRPLPTRLCIPRGAQPIYLRTFWRRSCLFLCRLSTRGLAAPSICVRTPYPFSLLHRSIFPYSGNGHILCHHVPARSDDSSTSTLPYHRRRPSFSLRFLLDVCTESPEAAHCALNNYSLRARWHLALCLLLAPLARVSTHLSHCASVVCRPFLRLVSHRLSLSIALQAATVLLADAHS